MNTLQSLPVEIIEQAERLHDQAMDTAERAAIAKLHQNAQWRELFRQAFTLEREAALTFVNDYNFEPSRSVLYRSAAALALECSEWRAAEQLIAAALAGSPPDEIAEELRDLLQQVYSVRVRISHAA